MVGKVNGNAYMYQYMNQNQTNNQQNGLGKIMKTLNPEQRKEVSSYLQSMSQDQRQQIVQQLKQMDVSNMNQDQIYSSIMNIISNYQAQSVATSSTGISIYA